MKARWLNGLSLDDWIILAWLVGMGVGWGGARISDGRYGMGIVDISVGLLMAVGGIELHRWSRRKAVQNRPTPPSAPTGGE